MYFTWYTITKRACKAELLCFFWVSALANHWTSSRIVGDLRRHDTHVTSLKTLLICYCGKYYAVLDANSIKCKIHCGFGRTFHKTEFTAAFFANFIIHLNLLTLCCPVQFWTPFVFDWNMHVASYRWIELKMARFIKMMCCSVGSYTWKTIIFYRLGMENEFVIITLSALIFDKTQPVWMWT